jgi:hypothetical protein
MPLTRRALLISNPGELGHVNYCKGVYVDTRNYERLLTSPIGGAWDPKEIQTFDQPTAELVQLLVAGLSDYDYGFIMFTGHGWYSSTDKEHVLELRRGENIYASDLLTGAKRRTLILDCCQRVYNEPRLIKEARAAEMVNARAASRREPNPDACRRLFLRDVEAAPASIVRTSSCSMNELSTDDDERGGRYNASLIEAAQDWANKQAQNPWVIEDALSIVAAHDPAARETIKFSGGTQNPTITKPRSEPYFPFAVFA